MQIGKLIDSIIRSLLVFFATSYFFPQFTWPWFFCYFAIAIPMVIWEKLYTHR